jgi:DNA-binding transcriptional LysR family regulator
MPSQGGTLPLFDEEFAMRLAATHAAATVRGPSNPRLADRLLAFARSWFARRAVLAELHGLDDRTLADLRIYPGDFQAIASGTYAREGGAHDVVVKSWIESSNRRFLPYF